MSAEGAPVIGINEQPSRANLTMMLISCLAGAWTAWTQRLRRTLPAASWMCRRAGVVFMNGQLKLPHLCDRLMFRQSENTPGRLDMQRTASVSSTPKNRTHSGTASAVDPRIWHVTERARDAARSVSLAVCHCTGPMI